MRPGLLKTIPEIDFNKALVEFISDMMNRQFDASEYSGCIEMTKLFD